MSLILFHAVYAHSRLTSVEAAHSARHGLGEDHPVLLGGSSIFTMGVMIQASLRNTQRHKAARTLLHVFWICNGLKMLLIDKQTILFHSG